MYDFVFQEEWWMETIIAAAITGVVSLVAAYLMYATKVEKNWRRLKIPIREWKDRQSYCQVNTEIYPKSIVTLKVRFRR